MRRGHIEFQHSIHCNVLVSNDVMQNNVIDLHVTVMHGFCEFTCGHAYKTVRCDALQRFAGWLAQICDENPRMRTLLVGILN